MVVDMVMGRKWTFFYCRRLTRCSEQIWAIRLLGHTGDRWSPVHCPARLVCSVIV